MMKRIHLIILLALAAIAGFAQSQPQTGDIIYVYQKDGNVLSFLRSEIEEMGYSYFDTLGVSHDEVVSQIISFGEDAHIIPLADIDSISFVTPKTVYQPGVIRIEEGLMDYVERSDSLTIYFAANTPSNLLPKVGDKLVTLEMNDKFEAGFAGRVASVSGTTVVCDGIELGEVFETYYETTLTEGRPADEPQARRRSIDFNRDMTFDFPTYSLDFGQEITANVIPLSSLALKGGIKLEASITPKARIKASLIVNKKQGTNFSGSIDFSASFKESVGLYGGFEKSSQFGLEVFKVPVCRFIKFYIKPGVFMDKSVESSITNEWEQTCGMGFSFSFTEKAKDPFKFNIINHKPTASYDLVGCVDGRLAAGIFTDMGLAPNIPIFGTKLLNIALHSEFGAEIIGHAVLYNEEIKSAAKETKTYEKLKASNIQVNSFVQHEVQKHLLTVDLIGPVASASKKFAQWDLVPRFTSISADRMDDVVEVTLQVEKSKDDLVVPVDFGVALYKPDNTLVAKDYLGNYLKGSDGGTFTNFFKDLDDELEYTVSPIVKIFGFELRASQTADVGKNEFPVQIINFEQTDANYSEVKGYTFEGKGYYYKFNATTTVELDKDAEKIKDWGYIYHDIYNVDKKISCANLVSNPYADTRWAYYYDEPYRTVSLTAYVQYEGETDIRKGGTHTFTVRYGGCPDNNHPHMIDLGLPSGTKWACCNIGASSPEQTGGYYAWGETQTKQDYCGDTYQFWVDRDGDGYFSYDFISLDTGGAYMVTNEIGDIGTDIANTQNDVATVKWGAPWRMPSLEQIRELYANTTHEWTEEKGVNGCRFKSSNFGVLFIPASGEYRSEDIYNYGKNVECWSSTQYRDSNQDSLLFSWGIYNDGRAAYGSTFRFYGLPVRPVR
ncbi:MAG: hypothetical protein K6G46_02730 [Prevotella sp.]|nr:hypothetical protein [Prevotella sp.]